MDQGKGGDLFHDSGREDLYDLYNACNGVMYNGLLDIRMLDELSAEEVEVLDLPRLREAWEHLASGCARCEAIIRTVNLARERWRKRRRPDPETIESFPYT